MTESNDSQYIYWSGIWCKREDLTPCYFKLLFYRPRCTGVLTSGLRHTDINNSRLSHQLTGLAVAIWMSCDQLFLAFLDSLAVLDTFILSSNEKWVKLGKDCAILSSVLSLVWSCVTTDYQHLEIDFHIRYCHNITSSFISCQSFQSSKQKLVKIVNYLMIFIVVTYLYLFQII